MSSRENSSRERLLRSTEAFQREYGTSATSNTGRSFSSSDLRCSAYHLSRDGRTQLTDEVVADDFVWRGERKALD